MLARRACRWRSSSGSLTLGFGFALFPLVVGGVGFLYRLATIGGGSATLGMRFAGIEYRRGDGTRFDATTTLLHTALYALCIAVPFLQLLSCLTILFTRYRQGVPDLRRGHDGDHPAGRLSAAFTACGESCCPSADDLLLPLGQKGEAIRGTMRHSLPQSHQFYVTAPQPCPYLPGKVERKLFTALQGEGACHLNDVLSHQGFRRSQNVLYRPSCAGCSACLSARIVVGAFAPTPQPAAGDAAQCRPGAVAARRPARPPAQYQLLPPLPRRRGTPPAAWPTWTWASSRR